jgi:putative alpha-1,2-mannosidase
MRTQERVRDLVAQNYNNTPQGISGVSLLSRLLYLDLKLMCAKNEDCGQMSAFYLFSAMGMYAVSPVDKNYSLTA